LKARLEGVTDAEQRIRIFIGNHLEYFMANQSGLKVLAHEDEALKNGFSSEIAAIKREYYRICLALMDDLKRMRKLNFNSRIAVMSLFGMINWIYTWYNPRIDGPADDLAREMSDFFLGGVNSSAASLSARTPSERSRKRATDRQFGDTRAVAAKRALKGQGVGRAARGQG